MRRIILLLTLLTQVLFAHAQHQHQHKMPMTDTTNGMEDMDMGEEDEPAAMKHEPMMMNMSHAYSLNLPMNRNGSGTGWLPDASPMYGYMAHANKWMFMFHGNIFLRYNNQDITNKGTRGADKIDAPNWLMAMGQRKIGRKGLFHFSTMFSLDAAIAGGSGYPLLFQSGETWQGAPLVDRQHPHDLVSELSVSYSYSFSKKADAYIYLGYPGEPAIGPVAFMHRPSALYNPDATITHHWIDATHITFGVATLGFRYGKFKLEGSSFTGREPNEDRYNFDKPRFDSWSGRLSFNPDEHWALQVSHAFINSPESLHPAEDINRTTASAIYTYALKKNSYFNATALWGVNKIPAHSGENAAMLEAAINFNRLALYGRYEWVQKSVEELSFDANLYGHDALFPVNMVTIGTAYDVLRKWKTRAAIGVQGSLYSADARLDKYYGNTPLAGEVYLRLYPGLMRMN